MSIKSDGAPVIVIVIVFIIAVAFWTILLPLLNILIAFWVLNRFLIPYTPLETVPDWVVYATCYLTSALGYLASKVGSK